MQLVNVSNLNSPFLNMWTGFSPPKDLPFFKYKITQIVCEN